MQCGTFHPLDRFTGARRSCRDRLRKHAIRRRKSGGGEGEEDEDAVADTHPASWQWERAGTGSGGGGSGAPLGQLRMRCACGHVLGAAVRHGRGLSFTPVEQACPSHHFLPRLLCRLR